MPDSHLPRPTALLSAPLSVLACLVLLLFGANHSVEAHTISIIKPESTEVKTKGEPREDYERDQLCFRILIEALYQPVEYAPYAQVTVHYKKGATEKTAPMTHVGDGVFRWYFNVTKLFTKAGASNRYRIWVTATYPGGSIRSPEADDRYICILKGLQVWRTAQDWLHYPYHNAGVGGSYYPQGSWITYCDYPESCDPIPADQHCDHTLYDTSTHPGENENHHCCFDCSGFSAKMYSHLGIAYVTPWVANTQYAELNNMGWDISPVSSALMGDLLYYQTDPDPALDHVSVKGPPRIRRDAPRAGEWTQTRIIGSPDNAAGPSAAGWCMTSSCSH